MDSRTGGQVNIVVENVLGSTVNRIATLTNPGSSYEIVAGGTVALVRGTTLGHRNDGNGNITVYLINSNNTVTFPNNSNTMYNGEICTYTPAGDLLCSQAKGQDVWSALADGDSAGGTEGGHKNKPDDNVTTTTTTTTTTTSSTTYSTTTSTTTTTTTTTSTTSTGPGF